MASVQYQVQYKYIHPLTNSPVTNRQSGYDAYGAFIESSEGVAKPKSATGEWPEKQALIRPFILGSGKSGIERKPSYLDELTGYDPETKVLQKNVTGLRAQIDAYTKERDGDPEATDPELKKSIAEKMTEIEERLTAGYPGVKPTFAKGVVTYPAYSSTSSSGATTAKRTFDNSDSDLKFKEASLEVFRNTSNYKYELKITHDPIAVDLATKYKEYYAREVFIGTELTTLSADLDTNEIELNAKIGKVAPQSEKNFVSDRNYPTSEVYDMLFYFRGSKLAFTKEYEFGAEVGGSSNDLLNCEIYIDTFEQVKGTPWFVLSQHGSLNSAMKAAEPIIKRIGKSNVQIVKIVPMDVRVGIE